MRTAAEVGEKALLDELLALWHRPDADGVQIGPGDDAAVIRMAEDTVLSVDSIVAGQDWLADQTPPDAIGHRAAAVNLSDLAAMGATPRYLLVALELNAQDDIDDLLEAALGLSRLCDTFNVAVIGGDIGIGEGPQRWTVTAIGAKTHDPLKRSNAQPGHRVWLLGNVGQAALGLHALLHGRDDSALQPCIEAHLRPQPLVLAGQRIARLSGQIAAIDVSDGLWIDAARLAQSSACGLRLHVPRPDWMNPQCEQLCRELGWDWRDGCATGGDDYALLVTAPWEIDVSAAVRDVCAVTAIGIVEAHSGVQLDVDAYRLSGTPRGYLHGG